MALMVINSVVVKIPIYTKYSLFPVCGRMCIKTGRVGPSRAYKNVSCNSLLTRNELDHLGSFGSGLSQLAHKKYFA